MASKTYIVKKGGAEIEKLKTLTAAKKLADAEGAEVFSGKECVYQGNVRDAAEDAGEASEATAGFPVAEQTGKDEAAKSTAPEQTGQDEAAESTAPERTENDTTAEQEAEEKANVTAGEPVQPETGEADTQKYRLKALMNVRKKPSKESDILGTRPAGTVVDTTGIEGDWLHLRDGAYILYENGKYAEKL